MSLENIEHIDGVRIILPQVVRPFLNISEKELVSIEKNFYFFLNSSDNVVGKIVANKREVINEKLLNEISGQLKNLISGTEKKSSFWILDTAGSGKTTLLTQLAFQFSQQNFPTVILNAALLKNKITVEYLSALKDYFGLHNPLILFVDNAGVCYETINALFEILNEDKSNFNCHLLLFERTQRYKELPNRAEMTIGKNALKMEINSNDQSNFKSKVMDKFFKIAELNEIQKPIAKKLLSENPQLSIGEQIVFLRRELPAHTKLNWKTDWDEFEESTMQFDWLSLHKLYSYVAILDQFGIPTPLSLLERIVPKLNKNEWKQFKKIIKSKKTHFLPFIVDPGNFIRTNHELVAEWHADSQLTNTFKDYLSDFLKKTDTSKEEEKKIFFNLCSKKSIHSKYEYHFSKDFGNLLNVEEISENSYKLFLLSRLMANDKFKSGDVEGGRKYYEKCIALDPQSRPVYMEWANHEEQKNNFKKSVIVLKRLLYNNPDSVNRAARRKLVENYLHLKDYARAKDFLFANEKLLLTDKKYEEFWTLFIKIYHQFVRLELWLTEEVETLRLKILYFNERHYKLCRFYLENKDWENAKNHLLCTVRIKPNDDFFVDELKKLYSKMGKSPLDISRIMDAILYHPLNLNMIKKVEKSKGELKVPVE